MVAGAGKQRKPALRNPANRGRSPELLRKDMNMHQELEEKLKPLMDGIRSGQVEISVNGTTIAPNDVPGGVAVQELKQFVDRIEHLETEKAGIADDISNVYSEAKGRGYDVKVLRKVVALRKLDPQERREGEELLDLYLSALGE